MGIGCPRGELLSVPQSCQAKPWWLLGREVKELVLELPPVENSERGEAARGRRSSGSGRLLKGGLGVEGIGLSISERP